MSWSRSSRLGLVVLSVLVAFAVVGMASAVSVGDEQAPGEAEVGEEVTVSVELQDLHAAESSWEIDGQTELDSAQWTIELYQDGEQYETRETAGSQPDPVLLEEGVTDAESVVVEITGTVPELSNASYADPATVLGGEVVQVVDGGSEVNYLSEQRIHQYTTESQEARTALDDANETIETTAANGADVSEAESTFEDAVAAFDGGNFGDATSLAGDAASQAESADSGDDGGSDGGDGSDGGTSDDGGSSDGSDSASTNESGAGGNGTQSDGSGSSDGDGSSDDGSADGGSSDGAADGGSGDGATDDGSDDPNGSSSDDSGNSDDGGLLWIVLYVLLGALILGGVVSGAYLYQQRQQGPSRDPLG